MTAPADAFEVLEAPPQPLLISCEHASVRLPPGWHWPMEDAWLLPLHWSHDIGAEPLAREIAAACKAPAVLARFSRLLIDPNRPEDSTTLIRSDADGRRVHLNIDVSEEDRRRRLSYWRAYHDELGRRAAAEETKTLFAVHSFTDVYEGQLRPFEIGVLFDRDEALAVKLAEALSTFAETRLNEPYSGKQGMIYAAQRHADSHGLAAVEIEVRQDRILSHAFREKITAAVAKVLTG